MGRSPARGLIVVLGLLVLVPAPAHAQERCARAVVVALPGVTWADVKRETPPALLEAASDGATGSVSVRTNSARTTYASGFATIGAGARVDGGKTTGGSTGFRIPRVPLPPFVGVANVGEIAELAEAANYGAVPGALAEAVGAAVIAIGNSDLGNPPAAPSGRGRWALLAAMNPRGAVDFAAVGGEMLETAPGRPYGVVTDMTELSVAIDTALIRECAVVIVDPGDLVRADQYEGVADARDARRAALMAADATIVRIRDALDESDLLLIVSPTSPAWDDDAHLGVAVAVGPGFGAGRSLVSASTGRPGIVTLTDVAPTILEHLGIDRPAWMLGRPWNATEPVATDRIRAAVELDEEAVFVDRARGPVSTAFVIFQVLIYASTALLLVRGSSRSETLHRVLTATALMIVSFPLCTYLAGILEQDVLGGTGFTAALLVVDLTIVMVLSVALRAPLDRLLAVATLTTLVLMVDLLWGSNLQLNTVFAYSPIVAGRFSGIGNIAFSVLAASTLIAGTVTAHRFKGTRWCLPAVAALFVAAVVIDGAPGFGSDVGGVIALVPGLAFTWMLLAERRLDRRTAYAAIALVVVAIGVFLVIDLARPPESRTHLARLFEDVRDRGPEVLVDTVVRKLQANLRVFRSTIWTYLVPPALAFLGWLLLRPRGRWQRFARVYPTLRAGLLGGLLIAVLGFAVNDSGIVVPAMILSFLVPVAMLTHLLMEHETEARAP